MLALNFGKKNIFSTIIMVFIVFFMLRFYVVLEESFICAT